MADDQMAATSGWAKHKALHGAVLAKARGGREWPFAVGDKVLARGNWGPLCCDLRIYTDDHPYIPLTVHETCGDGRWLSLRNTDGRVYDGPSGPSYGPTYFRITGECGDHFPGYKNPGWPGRKVGAYYCLRCDVPMPVITRKLLGDLIDDAADHA